MTRRVVKNGFEFEAFREARPAVRRRFYGGTVLNLLQWVDSNIARFTVEGEGVENWCCPKSVFVERTYPVEMARDAAGKTF